MSPLLIYHDSRPYLQTERYVKTITTDLYNIDIIEFIRVWTQTFLGSLNKEFYLIQALSLLNHANSLTVTMLDGHKQTPWRNLSMP